MAVNWPKTTARILTKVTGESHPDIAMGLVLKDAIAHRLEGIALEQGRFESKYGMTFEEYKKRWESEDKPESYAYEAEFDYLEWEALDTRKARLESAQAWLT